MNNVCCPTDEELVPLLAGETVDDSLSSHLSTCDSCRRRLDVFRSDLDALRSVPLGELSAEPSEPAAPARPAMIGKYLVVGALDSGGQAQVFRALHPTLDTELAIKLSRRAVGKLSDHRPLLVAEGKLLARLEHPSLARIYDLDFHDDLPFLAMEYVRGQNLRQYGGGQPLSPRRAAAIVAGVARALGTVHRHGVVHQDVKPQNILMDDTDRPRLIDFGMARLRHAWDAGGTGSPSGGTPAFMAPEQARGESAAVGPRSDIFSLGGVLYFLLTAKTPFDAPDVLTAIKRAGACDFDRAALDRAGVPRRLRDICLKAMAANPGDRYPRADDFADALENFLTRPRRMARLAAFAAAAGLAGVAGVWLSKSGPAPVPVPPGPVAVAPAETPLQLEVVIDRGGKSLGLLEALPLDAKTDRVQVIGRVPPGHHVALFHVNAKGKVRRLPVVQSPADAFTRVVSPGNGKTHLFEQDVPGTEVVLLCAAESQEALDELENALGLCLNGLLPLPPKTVIRLSRDEPKRESSPSFGKAEPDPTAQVEERLDELRKRLRDRKLPLSVIRGVAYSR